MYIHIDKHVCVLEVVARTFTREQDAMNHTHTHAYVYKITNLAAENWDLAWNLASHRVYTATHTHAHTQTFATGHDHLHTRSRAHTLNIPTSTHIPANAHTYAHLLHMPSQNHTHTHTHRHRHTHIHTHARARTYAFLCSITVPAYFRYISTADITTGTQFLFVTSYVCVYVYV
jgi:hypothetical protein